jgi:hypothetical protein
VGGGDGKNIFEDIFSERSMRHDGQRGCLGDEGTRENKKGYSHEHPNSISVNLKSNTIMKKLRYKGTGKWVLVPNIS